jgi:uncharacterized membrane protein
MPELLVTVAFIAALFIIEIWYVRHNQTTISEHAQSVIRRMDKQLVAGIFFLLGAIAGWFVAHFST